MALTLIILSVIIFAFLCSRMKYFVQGFTLPGPPALPLFGNLLSFRTRDLPKFFEETFHHLKAYKNIMRLWIGPVLLVIVSGPDEIEKIVESDKIGNRGIYSRRVLGSMFRDGLLSIDVKLWRPHRKIISSAFHTNILETYVENFSKNSEILVNRLAEFADGSISVDIVPFLCQCTLDIICETCFAYEINAQINNDPQTMANIKIIMDATTIRVTDPLLMYDWIFNLTKLGKKYNAAVKYYHNIIRNAIETKTKAGECEKVAKRPALLELLLQNGEMSSEEIIGEMSSIGGAGSETTATACCFVLAMLGEHQDIQERVLEEQRNIFWEDFSRPVASEDLVSMTYLEQVLNETMRIFPPLPFQSREAVKDVDLGDGKIIPAGAPILIAAYDTHRNPKFFGDPERFDPERFSATNVAGRHPYSFIPFGIGRRICVGRNFSIMEAKTILSTVLRRFHILGVEGGLEGLQRDLHVSIVLTSSNGIRLKILPRTK